ncbi:MAG: FkbM family methyltransferase [Flavobacteriaceae bacterium]|nr:FkbM family methyltransferase [Flavobacteriaceae bacterium]
MANFKKQLDRKIIQSLKNNYGVENYDEYRFGEFPLETKSKSIKAKKNPLSAIDKLKKVIKKIIGYNSKNNAYLTKGNNLVNPYLKEFENIWNNISDLDRELLISLIAYRVLGFKKVKLSRNNSKYWKAIETAKTLVVSNETINPHFLHFVLKKMDLNPIGFDIQFYYTEKGIAVDFLLEQYAYKLEKKRIVSVEKGDIVLDLGGCWGDTALYFAHEVGDEGKVYSFEFIPGNIEILKRNLSMNTKLQNRITLVPNPVTNKSNDIIYYKDNGPGSKVSADSFIDQTGTCKTVSIDEFVKTNAFEKLDFIKMDIEGAEPLALEGAIESIKRFRPKLAIAIYHSMSDFATIPNWILNLNLDYEIFIGHYTIHAEETICFAKPKNKLQ